MKVHKLKLLLFTFGLFILLLNIFISTKMKGNIHKIRKGIRGSLKLISPHKKKITKLPKTLSPERKNQEFEDEFKIAKEQLSSEYQRLTGYPNFKLEFPFSKSSMKRILLLTSWRSGSSFTGRILGAYPGAFYLYEPLHSLGVRYVREGHEKKRMIGFLKDVMTCNVESYEDIFDHYRTRPFIINSNSRYWKACYKNRDICFKQEFFNQICRLMPINVMKVIRIKVQQIKDLIADPDLNLKVIHLIRDPRGTLLSRKRKKWCIEKKTCIDPKTFCGILEKDLVAAKKFTHKYPENFLQIRYEDLATRSHEMVKRLLEFVGLPYIEKMKTYVEKQTTGRRTRKNAHSKNSAANAFKWRKTLDFKKMSVIQESCSSVLKLLNFRIFKNEKEYKNETLSVFL